MKVEACLGVLSPDSLNVGKCREESGIRSASIFVKPTTARNIRGAGKIQSLVQL